MRLNVYSLAVFTGGGVKIRIYAMRYLHSNFTWTRSFPIRHSWRQKTRDTGLPDGEDRIPLRSLVWRQYRSVTDRRTDVHICLKLFQKLALRHAVIKLRQNYFSLRRRSSEVIVFQRVETCLKLFQNFTGLLQLMNISQHVHCR